MIITPRQGLESSRGLAADTHGSSVRTLCAACMSGSLASPDMHVVTLRTPQQAMRWHRSPDLQHDWLRHLSMREYIAALTLSSSISETSLPGCHQSRQCSVRHNIQPAYHPKARADTGRRSPDLLQTTLVQTNEACWYFETSPARKRLLKAASSKTPSSKLPIYRCR